MTRPLETLPTSELLQRLHQMVERGRIAEAELLVHLGEVDARRLYLEQACPSMFAWCVRVLHFAEGAAYKRIQVARAARRHPELIEAIRRGDLHVTAASLLVPQLTRDNVCELVQAARHRTTDQVRELLGDRRPKPDLPASVQRMPAPTPARTPAPAETPSPLRPRPVEAPARPAPLPPRPEPLGDERYAIRFTAGPETHAELQQLRALMRHQVPDGDVGKILARAISCLLRQVRKQKFAEVESRESKPAPSTTTSRAIPAAIRREVSRRDGERCTYVSSSGRRCDSREFLEFHHLDPWQRNRHHSVEGITLRCRPHNQHQAERDFGAGPMARFRRPESPPGGTGFKTSPR